MIKLSGCYVRASYLLSNDKADKSHGKLPFPFVRRVGRMVGLLGLRFDRRTRQAIDRNLELCLPHLDKEQRVRLRNSRLQHMGQTFAEMGHLWTRDGVIPSLIVAMKAMAQPS